MSDFKSTVERWLRSQRDGTVPDHHGKARYNAFVEIVTMAKQMGMSAAELLPRESKGSPWNVIIAACFDGGIGHLSGKGKERLGFIRRDLEKAIYAVFDEVDSSASDISEKSAEEAYKEPLPQGYKPISKSKEPEAEPTAEQKEFSSAAEANAALAKLGGQEIEPDYDDRMEAVLGFKDEK